MVIGIYFNILLEIIDMNDKQLIRFNPGGREAVIPLPPSGPPELGAARQVTVIRLELDGRLLTEVVHDGLLAKQRKSGNLGLVA